MGKFKDARRKPTRKHPQIWHGIWGVLETELPQLAKAVAEASDRYVFEVLDPIPGQDKGVVRGTCTYTARGANKTDVAKHIFEENGLVPVFLALDKEHKVKMLCECARQDDPCADDDDHWP